MSETANRQAVQSDALLDVLRAVSKCVHARRELLLKMGPMTTERADALYDLACCIDEVITDLSSNMY